MGLAKNRSTRNRRVRCSYCGGLFSRKGLPKHEKPCAQKERNFAEAVGWKVKPNDVVDAPQTYTAQQYDRAVIEHKLEKNKLEQIIEKQKRSATAMRSSMHLLFRAVAEAIELLNE